MSCVYTIGVTDIFRHFEIGSRCRQSWH